MPTTSQVYLDGKFLPPEQARVSVFDRGFIFGDGVYEVIPVFGGRLFRLPHHLARLEASLAAIRLRNPHTAEEWKSIFTRLMAEHETSDQSIYLQITRGVAPRDHAFPPNPVPTVFAYAQPLKYPPAEQLTQGVTAITTVGSRLTPKLSRSQVRKLADQCPCVTGSTRPRAMFHMPSLR